MSETLDRKIEEFSKNFPVPLQRINQPVLEGEQYALFTSQAVQVMICANHEAYTLHDEYVGPLHILFGLLGATTTSVADHVLTSFGITTQRIREMHGCQDRVSIHETHLPLTRNALDVITRAHTIAQQLHHAHIGTEHLLLAIVRNPDSRVSNFLRAVEIDRDRIDHATLSIINIEPIDDDSISPEARNELVRKQAELETPTLGETIKALVAFHDQRTESL